jgi:hypothetical protein
MQTIEQLKARYNKERGEQDMLKKKISEYEDSIKRTQNYLTHVEEARQIVQQVAKITQEQIVVNISSIVCLALSTVFDDPYKFGVEFVTRRNKTECDMFFLRGENRLDDLEDESGGGTVDIAAFGLRCASLVMEEPQKRNVLILDEPFPHLRGEDNQKRTSEMVKRISNDLGIQMIIVGDVNFSISADKIIHIKKINDNVKVEVC